MSPTSACARSYAATASASCSSRAALSRLAAARAADLDATLVAFASGASDAPRGPRRFGRYELRAEFGHGGMG